MDDADDTVIFGRAREAGAVVAAKDRDFVDLLERHGPPPQVLWLTCGNTSNVYLRELLASVWPKVAELIVAGEPLVEIGGRPT